MIEQPTTDYVAVDLAGSMTGIPARTLRYWIGTGKLAATAGTRGKLVSVADVVRLAGMAGRTAGNHNGLAGNGVASAGNGAGNLADESFATNDSVLVRDGGRQQLALIRDEWLAPLVATIGDLERQVGRLEAERDQARREADELRARLDVHTIGLHIAPVETHAIETHTPPVETHSMETHTPPRPWWRQLVARLRH